MIADKDRPWWLRMNEHPPKAQMTCKALGYETGCPSLDESDGFGENYLNYLFALEAAWAERGFKPNYEG